MNGFTLLEVLIALSILSVGLLAIAELETVALQRNSFSYQQSVAVQQKLSGSERLLVGHKANELLLWKQNNAQLLPQGKGEYVLVKQTVKVCWHDRISGQTECI